MGRHADPVGPEQQRERPSGSTGRHTAPVPVQRPVAQASLRIEGPLRPTGSLRPVVPAAVRSDVRVEPQELASPRAPQVAGASADSRGLARESVATAPVSGLLPAPPPARQSPTGAAFTPRRASGTVAALPATGPVPMLGAPSLHTAPTPVQPAPAERSRPIGRLVALVAGLVVAGSVAAQLTAQNSLADAPLPVTTASTSAGSPTGSTEASTAAGSSSPAPADSGTSPSQDSGGATLPSGPLPSRPGAPSDAPSASASSDPSDGASQEPSEDPSRDPSASASASSAPSASSSEAPSSTPSASAGTPSSSPIASRTADPSPSASQDPEPSTPAPTSGDASVVRSLRAAASAAGGKDLTLGAGSWRFDDFRADLLGVNLVGDLVGAGSDRTSIQMNAHSSSRRSSVPKKDWDTNQLSLLKVSGASRISGFTLRGTDQDHLYNGLRISKSDDTRISDVKVIAVPGGDDIPPGETFGINDFHTDGSRYSGVEVDGNDIAAAAFGTNSSDDTTIEDSWFHDSGHANGATFWQTRNVTVRDTRSTGNYDAGFNFERVSGTVLLDHVTMKNNRLSHLRINSDKGSATYRIVDPVFDGPKLKILMTAKYMGSPNLQKRSDVHVIIDGVDRTDDVVQWVTHF